MIGEPQSLFSDLDVTFLNGRRMGRSHRSGCLAYGQGSVPFVGHPRTRSGLFSATYLGFVYFRHF